LQRHAAAQPIDEDAGDPRTFFRLAGLALDDRGQDQRLPRVGERQVGGAVRPGLGQGAVHRRIGATHDGGARLAPFEGVGLGQQIALVELGDVPRQALDAFQQGADLVRAEPLGDRQAALHRAFLAQDAQHLGQRGCGGKGEFRGAQRAGIAGQPGRRGEGSRVADHAAFQQRLRDALGAAAGDDDLHGLGKRARARIGPPGGRGGKTAGQQQDEKED